MISKQIMISKQNKTADVDKCEFAHAMSILDKVDAGQLGSFDGSYMYHCDPWFLDTLRVALRIAGEDQQVRIKEYAMKEYIVDCSWFTDPDGRFWSHPEQIESNGKMYWFSLEEAFRLEKEYNNE